MFSGFLFCEFSCVTTKLIPVYFQFVSITHRGASFAAFEWANKWVCILGEWRFSLSLLLHSHCNLQANWKSQILLTRIIIIIILILILIGIYRWSKVFIYLFTYFLLITSQTFILCVCVRECVSLPIVLLLLFNLLRHSMNGSGSEIDIDIGLLKARAIRFFP